MKTSWGGCLYLNNNGSRWITDDMDFYLELPDGTRKLRKADYYESFGNFAVYGYRYQGKRFSALPNDTERYEGLPVIAHGKARKVSKN